MGILEKLTSKKPKKLKSVPATLSPNAVYGHQILRDNGSVEFVWKPAKNPENVVVSRVATKTLKLGRLKADAESENFKNKDEYSLIFVPCHSTSNDVRLLILRNTLDKQFMLRHAPSLNNPIAVSYTHLTLPTKA